MRLPPYHSKATSFWYVNVYIGSRFVTCWPNCHWHLQAIGDLQICPHDPKHPEPPMIVFDRQNTDSVEAKNSVKLNATAVSLSRNLDLFLNPASFLFILSFSKCHDKNGMKFDYKWKKRRLCAWDSNLSRRMVGADESTELWRPTLNGFVSLTIAS